MGYSEFASKKVAGIPVLYLAGGGVAILAVVAWKMKATKTPADNSSTATDSTNPAVAAGSDSADLSSLNTQGTVTVVQQPAQTTPDATVKTNATWVRDGATWASQQKLASATDASTALTNYINGGNRTYDEDTLINKVIDHQGLPPEDIAEGGKASTKPAQKQFPAPPGVHTIMGSSDDTWPEIATLYYGIGSPRAQDMLQFANPSIGSSPGPFAIGTKITVPVFNAVPRTYKVPRGPMTWAAVAAKNGISETQLKNLNNGPAAWRNAPTLATGQVVVVG